MRHRVEEAAAGTALGRFAKQSQISSGGRFLMSVEILPPKADRASVQSTQEGQRIAAQEHTRARPASRLRAEREAFLLVAGEAERRG
jgi:hypothetical protein